MLHFLIATANYEDSDVVRKLVKQVLASSNLTEDADYYLREFPTSKMLTRYLTERQFLQKKGRTLEPTPPHDKDGQAPDLTTQRDYALVIAQPILTDLDDTKPVLRALLKGESTDVALLLLNNASAGRLAVTPERRLTDLGVESVQVKLRDIVREFLKRHELYDYRRLYDQLQEYKMTLLAPSRRASESHRSGEARPQGDNGESSDTDPLTDLQRKWQDLVDSCLKKAQLTCGDAIEQLRQSKPAPVQPSLRRLFPWDKDRRHVYRYRLLGLTSAYLYLWVEARLCLLRARINYGFSANAQADLAPVPATDGAAPGPPGFGFEQVDRKYVKNQIRNVMKGYFKTLREFDTNLKRKAGKKRAVRRFGDAEQFRAWSEEFGPKNVNRADEPGWEVYARDAGEELFLQYRNAQRREYWQDWSTWPQALILQLYAFVAKYGFSPARTLLLSLNVFFGFILAHELDDRLLPTLQCQNSPSSFPGLSQDLLRALGYYLGVSTSSLTSLGAVTAPCGELYSLLSAAESLIGFFLMAILTTLFVQSILER